mgnify:CR=1 FL=1
MESKSAGRGEASPGAADMPDSQCPRCKAWLPDYDGFGVLAHTKPAYPDGCGYCKHPAVDRTAAGWVCGFCGQTIFPAATEVASHSKPEVHR